MNARLIDASSGFQKRAKRYDRQVAEVFAVQHEVTSSVVEALAVKLSRREAERLARRSTNNIAAYGHFQEGQRLVKVSTPETNRQAQAACLQAVEPDPSDGHADGALGYTLATSYRRGWTDDPQQTLERALELAKASGSTIPSRRPNGRLARCTSCARSTNWPKRLQPRP